MEQEVTRQIFLRLVTLGEGVEDTRRRVLRSELEAIARHSQSSADSQEAMSGVGESASSLVGGADIIDMFGTARLLTFDRDAATRSPTVEVAHEALLREWQRLRAWLEASRDDIRSQRLLARATVEWLRADKDESYLLRGARLSQYEGWARASSVVLTGDERTYLENSVASREVRQVEDKARRQRELETARALAETEQARAAAESKRAEEQAGAALRLRRLVIVLVGLLFVAAALAVLAEQERDKAEELARISRSRELAAASIISQNTNSELSLLLAIQALSTAETNEAEQALHMALLTSRVRQRLVGHETALPRVAYSPDGRLIALYAAGEDLATIWDAASGRKLHELPVSRCCWGIYFDDAGQRLAAVEPGMNFNITLWDTDTGERLERFSLPVFISEIGGYYLHPDWSRAAIFLTDGTLSVWDIESGTQLFDLPGHSGFVELEYSKDGRRLVTYDNPDGLVIVWDALTGELLRRFETGQFINDHAVSPDGRWLALAVDAGEAGWEVHVWDVDAPQDDDVVSPSARLTGHPETIRLIDFSADGRMVASASRDGTARIWDRETGELLFVLPHGTHVRSVVFHPAGHSLLTSDLNGVARVWDITPQGSSEHLGLVVNDGLVFDADISPDGQTLVTGGTAKLWDLATGTLLQTLIGHGDMVMSVAFDPDGRRVATASLDGTARVWDTATGVELYRLEAHGDESPAWTGLSGVLSVAYHPDGDRLATAGTDRTARIWDSESGEQLHVLEGHTAGLATVAFSPDGNYLATGQASGTDLNVEALPTTVRLWDTETGQGMFFFNSGHGQRVWGLAFSPDGNFLATVGTDAAVRLWALDFDAGRAELRETLTSHTNTVIGVAFSPDGRILATATPDEVRLWDVGPLYDSSDAGAIGELFVLPGGAALAFSPDGSELITAGRDGLMRAYLLDTAELLSFAQTRLTRWWTEAECRQYLHVTNCPDGISE
jgi:WD40 repeat protein